MAEHHVSPDLHAELADIAGLLVAEATGDQQATPAFIRALLERGEPGEILRLLHLALATGGQAVRSEIEAAAATDGHVPASLSYLVAVSRHTHRTDE